MCVVCTPSTSYCELPYTVEPYWEQGKNLGSPLSVGMSILTRLHIYDMQIYHMM